jgi:hypothetical protein
VNPASEGNTRRVSAIALAAALSPAFATAAGVGLPGARSMKVCAAACPYWPTMTLAVQGASAWLACKEQFRVVRVSTATGKATKFVRLGAQAIAVRYGFGSVWALDTGESSIASTPGPERSPSESR